MRKGLVGAVASILTMMRCPSGRTVTRSRQQTLALLGLAKGEI